MEFITNGKSAESIANEINKITTNAKTNPTVNDDESLNYFIGSKWLNTSTNQEFTCVDATTGAAVWVLGTPDMATQSEAESGTNTTKAMSPLRVFQAIAKWVVNSAIGTIGSLTNSAIATTDSISGALGKLQAQINAANTSISTTNTNLSSANTKITSIQSSITSLQSKDTSLQTQINAKQKTITYGTSAPSGGSSGDVYDQYF